MGDVVYVAGPMSGLPDFNYPAFHEAAARLRARGYQVVCPAESFNGRTDLPRETYMRRAVHGVLRADLLAVIEGWERSEGARLEVAVARAVGTPVRCADCLIYATSSVCTQATADRVPVAPRAAAVALTGGSACSQSQESTSESILEEAARIVSGDRRRDYDHPLPNHERIGVIWGVQLEKYLQEARPRDPVPPRTVALMMVGLKLAREAYSPKRDNILDVIGYAVCIDEIESEQARARGEVG